MRKMLGTTGGHCYGGGARRESFSQESEISDQAEETRKC